MRDLSDEPYKDLEADGWWWPDSLPDEETLEDGQELLTTVQRRRFIRDGFLFLNNLWPDELIAKAREETRDIFPEDQVIGRAMNETRYHHFSAMPWTYRGETLANLAINHMALHPRALRAVSELLQTEVQDIRLYQDHLIAKCGRVTDFENVETIQHVIGDQDIHVDYGNNTLLVPPRAAGPEVVACLCFYSDVEEVGGATHFVKADPGELTQYQRRTFNPPNFVFGTSNGSALGASGQRSTERTRLRYQKEKPLRYKMGSCVLYRLDAWHRGTPVRPHKVRYTHHHGWKKKNAEWVNWQGFAQKLSQLPNAFLENLSVNQRTVLSFAAPGDAYWTEETLDSVSQRYPLMDMSAYRAAIPLKD